LIFNLPLASFKPGLICFDKCSASQTSGAGEATTESFSDDLKDTLAPKLIGRQSRSTDTILHIILLYLLIINNILKRIMHSNQDQQLVSLSYRNVQS
jgi:hypothetical protein